MSRIHLVGVISAIVIFAGCEKVYPEIEGTGGTIENYDKVSGKKDIVGTWVETYKYDSKNEIYVDDPSGDFCRGFMEISSDGVITEFETTEYVKYSKGVITIPGTVGVSLEGKMLCDIVDNEVFVGGRHMLSFLYWEDKNTIVAYNESTRSYFSKVDKVDVKATPKQLTGSEWVRKYNRHEEYSNYYDRNESDEQYNGVLKFIDATHVKIHTRYSYTYRHQYYDDWNNVWGEYDESTGTWTPGYWRTEERSDDYYETYSYLYSAPYLICSRKDEDGDEITRNGSIVFNTLWIGDSFYLLQ